MSLSISLLGVFQASLNGQKVAEFYSSKVRALLAYLAMEAGREHPRTVLGALLWPDWEDRAALGNLRFSLSKLRQAIGDQDASPSFLLISRDTIQLNPAADISVDACLFRQELHASRWEEADADGQPAPVVRSALEHLRTAMELVRGPFLEGFSVGDSAAFEEWMLFQRAELERQARQALHGLTALHSHLGEHAAAERTVRQLLDMDPWDELANRRLMTVLVQKGQRNAALQHYGAYHDALARELGCEPVEETQALYAQIRDGTLPQPHPPTAGSPTSLSPPIAAGAQPSRGFVAREPELSRLDILLHRALAGQGSVALIAGEAGSGKTALLDEFSRQASQARDDLLVLRGSCNAHAGAGDPYLPFRDILQTLAGDVEGKRAGGTLSLEQARRAWEALPAVSAVLVEHGPDLVERFVPGEALLQRIEGFPGPPGARRWLPRLREIQRRAREAAASSGSPDAAMPQPDLFSQVTGVLQAISTSKPLLLAIDDLQWADAGTAALLFHLGRRLAGSRIFLMCAYRPGAAALEPPPVPHPPLQALREGRDVERDQATPGPESDSAGIGAVLQELTREWGDILIDLDRADGRAFVEAYVDGEPNHLDGAFRQALYDHTGGNPLFTAELLRSFQRQGALVQDADGRWIETAELDWDVCPPRVEAVIAGHLTGLPDEDRTLLQAASVQGGHFAAEVVARVLGWSDDYAVQRLSGPLRTWHRLVETVSVDRLPSTGQLLSHYRFRHALLQASAYRSLDAVQQARLHEATGRALAAVYAAEKEQPPALAPELARHFEAARLPLEAARYRLEAGTWAVRLLAHDEAIAHLERGLALLEGAPASREQLRLEFSLLLALVNPAVLQQGCQSPAVKTALSRLFELAQHPTLQDNPQRLTALVLLALESSWSANPERGQRVAEKILELISSAVAGKARDGNRQSLMLAHWTLGLSHWLQGQLTAAREHLDLALALHNREASRPLWLLFPGEPGVTGHAILGYVQWLLGYPDQGRSNLQEALALAQEIKQPRTTAFAHAAAGALYSIGRNETEVLKHVQALRTLGAAGQIYLEWAEMLTGHAGAAGLRPKLRQDIPQAEEANSVPKDIDSGVGQAMQLLARAQKLVRAGQPAVALEAVDQALAWIEHSGVRVLEAEAWRMRGEVLLAAAARRPTMDDTDTGSSAVHPPSTAREAEACFQRALETGRQQGARWLELRAAVSLARLWQAQGQREQARELLAGIYGWFTEGFDTVDLVEAKALLEQLDER